MAKYAHWIILFVLVAVLVYVGIQVRKIKSSGTVVLSDERAKYNISKTAFGSAYNKMKVVTPIEYMYRDAGAKNPYRFFCSCQGTGKCTGNCKSKIGFSAQNLKQVDPRLVVVGKNGLLHVDIAQMVALNSAAIREVIRQQEEYKAMTTPSKQSV